MSQILEILHVGYMFAHVTTGKIDKGQQQFHFWPIRGGFKSDVKTPNA